MGSESILMTESIGMNSLTVTIGLKNKRYDENVFYSSEVYFSIENDFLIKCHILGFLMWI